MPAAPAPGELASTSSPTATPSATTSPSGTTSDSSTTTGVTTPTSAPVTKTVTTTVTPTPSGGSGPGGLTTVTSTVTVSTTRNATVAPSPVSNDSGDRTSALAVAVAVAVLLLALGGLVAYLVRRARRSSTVADPVKWDADTTNLAATARWFGERLAPEVTDPSATASQRARGWRESRPMVADLEHELADRTQSAPDAGRAALAGDLLRAVSQLREAVDATDRGEDADVAAARERLGAVLVRLAASPN